MPIQPQRLDLFDLTLGAASYADEWGDRPCLVISHDFYNRRLSTVVVVTLTRQNRSADTGCVLVRRAAIAGMPGLDGDSYAVCHSPLTVPQDTLNQRRGRLTDRTAIVALENAIAFALELGPDPEDGF